MDSRVEVKTFDKSQLKHVETKEENTLPGAGGISPYLSSLNSSFLEVKCPYGFYKLDFRLRTPGSFSML